MNTGLRLCEKGRPEGKRLFGKAKLAARIGKDDHVIKSENRLEHVLCDGAFPEPVPVPTRNSGVPFPFRVEPNFVWHLMRQPQGIRLSKR